MNFYLHASIITCIATIIINYYPIPIPLGVVSWCENDWA